MEVTGDFSTALDWAMAWVNRDVELTASGNDEGVSHAALEGPLSASWDPEVMKANGFEDVVVLRVGQRGSVSLDADDFTSAERASDGKVGLYFGKLEIIIGEPLLLKPEP